MTALTLALSLSNSFTKVGAIAAFVALVGIAILSLLVFSQAREIKRLREWAGRAPERAVEMEQRVSAGAAARVQRGSVPVTSQGRVVPRTTPLVSAPVATAVSASAAAVTPAAGQTAAVPTAGQPATAVRPAAAQAPTAQAPTSAQAPTAGVPSAAAPASSPDSMPAQPSDTSPVSSPTGEPAAPSVTAQSVGSPAKPAAEPQSPAQPTAAQPLSSAGAVAAAESEREEPAGTPAPATAAAQGATRAAPRSPLPPSPAAPQPAAPRSGSIAASQASSSRVLSSRPRAAAGAVTDGAASRAAPPVSGGRKDFRQERSPTRAIVLGVGVLIVVVLVLIFAVSALKGGGSPRSSTTQNTTAAQTARSPGQTATTHKANQSAHAVNPAETSVVVLNGTGTTGLAHHLASDLQQSGYTHALASAAVPPGTHQTTVIEYSGGHRADAQGVARTLNVTQVQPMEATISGLAGSATVVVLAGADQAAQLGGGGAQSQGEPAAGQ